MILRQLEREGLDTALLNDFYRRRFPNHLGSIRNEDLVAFYEFINPKAILRAVSELDEGEVDEVGIGAVGFLNARRTA
jgi:hypothetical protein